MQPEQINSSDLLDILFADRNKMYGAYTLRRGYSRRLKKSLLITAALVCGMLALFYSVKNNTYSDFMKTIMIDIPPMVDTRVPDPPKPPEPPSPKLNQQVATVQYTSKPVIVQQTTKPLPPIDELLNAQPGTETKAGIPADGFPPPVATGKGIAEAAPVTAEPDNRIRERVDVESTYPGGLKAWKRFLIRTFRYPTEAQEKEIYGTVLIRFVVDKNGNVSDIEAMSGPGELRSEAIRVISKSGKWIPAIKDDSVVNSYKYQQILFQLADQ